MIYLRERYLKALVETENDGLIKIITGLRRSGKSYLMNVLFRNRLLSSGVDESHILSFCFDKDTDVDRLRPYFPDEPLKIKDGRLEKVNSHKFRAFLFGLVPKEGEVYFLLDEIQILQDFVGTLNSLLDNPRYHVYVTGSNSRLLSTDIATEFAGRGEVIHLLPLSFSEFCQGREDKVKAYQEYIHYGGIPMTYSLSEEMRQEFLSRLLESTYLKDICERFDVRDKKALREILAVLASSLGQPRSARNIANTFVSVAGKKISNETVDGYFDHFQDAFLLSQCLRFDLKGKTFLGAKWKSYFEDLGIRNAILGFNDFDETKLLENVVYNELRYRGYRVYAGTIEGNEKGPSQNGSPVYAKRQFEVDFVAIKGNEKYYIQSAFSLRQQGKREQEIRPFLLIPDYFKRILITEDPIPFYRDERGILTMNVLDFLLDEQSLYR